MPILYFWRYTLIYNSIFNSNSKISTSATFVDLQVLESINKKKSIHILIYIKKNDFKILTKSRYEDLLNSIIGEVNACNQMYSDKSFTEAKVQGDLIELEIMWDLLKSSFLITIVYLLWLIFFLCIELFVLFSKSEGETDYEFIVKHNMEMILFDLKEYKQAILDGRIKNNIKDIED